MTSTCCRSTVVATKSMQNASSLTTQNAPMNMMIIIRVVGVVPRGTSIKSDRRRVRGARASMVDSYESSSNNFVRRMEQAWLISQMENLSFEAGEFTKNLFETIFHGHYAVENNISSSKGTVSELFDAIRNCILINGIVSEMQPRPVACSSCESNGHIECKWCGGTGFFILGDNMLCQVPSKNSSCVICAGKGSTCCSDCKGTGFRAKWLGEPPISK
ncbi:hypothetical protein EZV62_013652 [Acer yangbiense]|uniref:Uncharacterized protein n=1 Tax=Acer yangbiense TaxID=1000413 RepID=A0A5C7I001_9ROSI|nr:hypothetical protein EZV62_013652 [Acer yangbiense]